MNFFKKRIKGDLGVRIDFIHKIYQKLKEKLFLN